MPLSAGILRHRITLQRAARSEDGAGGFDTIWNDVATVWARVRPTSAEEKFVAETSEMVTTHRVDMRYRRDISVLPGDRIKFGTRFFEIRGIINGGEMNDALELRCEEMRP